MLLESGRGFGPGLEPKGLRIRFWTGEFLLGSAQYCSAVDQPYDTLSFIIFLSSGARLNATYSRHPLPSHVVFEFLFSHLSMNLSLFRLQ